MSVTQKGRVHTAVFRHGLDAESASNSALITLNFRIHSVEWKVHGSISMLRIFHRENKKMVLSILDADPASKIDRTTEAGISPIEMGLILAHPRL